MNSFGILRSAERPFLIDVSDNLSSPISIGCPETSVRNYHSALRDIPEGRMSHPLCGGSLKSPVNVHSHISYHIDVCPVQRHVDRLRVFGLRLPSRCKRDLLSGDFT